MTVKFSVLGEPVGKGRPRFRNMGSFTKTYTPEKTVNYESLIVLEYRRQCGDFMFGEKVPLEVKVAAYFTIPKSESKKRKSLMLSHFLRPMKKPDVDNITKCVLDAGNKVIYPDDAQVVDYQIRKFYSENPRIVITIREAQPPKNESEESNEQRS